MLSFSIVYRIGQERFVNMCRDAGIDGLILPDLSLEEARAWLNSTRRSPVLAHAGLSGLPAERRRQIAGLSTGFVYYMSVTGITGERKELPPELVTNVRDLRQQAGRPVIVGFGISTAEQVRLVCSVADAAIIGSALIRRIMQAEDAHQSFDAIVQTAATAVREWMTGLA